MPATATTTIATFEVVLLRETTIAFGGEVIVTFLDGNSFSEIGHISRLNFDFYKNTVIIGINESLYFFSLILFKKNQ